MRVKHPAPDRTPPAGPSAHGRAVIVEEHPRRRSALAGLLAGLGYAVHAASHGVLGLRVARRARPDLVVLGPALAGDGGAGLLAELRAHPATAVTPVLVLADAPGRLTGGRSHERLLARPFTHADIVREVLDLTAPDGRAAAPGR